MRPTVAVSLLLLATPAGLVAQADSAGRCHDPRVGLRAGWNDAAEAASNLALIRARPRPAGFFNPANIGDFAFLDSDLAFSGHYVFQGNFNGLQIWDVSDVAKPVLTTTMVCPGGQGDPSIYGNLMFVSVEETPRPRRLRHAGRQGHRQRRAVPRRSHLRHFRHRSPEEVVDVQTCRGSHTHTLVPDPKDPGIVYVYVSGTSTVRPERRARGLLGAEPEKDPEHLAASASRSSGCRSHRPQDAKMVGHAAHLRRRQDRRGQRARQGR